MRKYIIFIIVFVVNLSNIFAHDSFIKHGEDIMAVFGFERNTLLFNRSKDTKNNTSWVKYISTDMIDNTRFHKELEQQHVGLNLTHPNTHRLLFHWGYNAEPWSDELEEHIRKYCEGYDLNVESNLRIFKAKIKEEQRRRNRDMNEKTERLFGFAHGGTDAKYARFFIAMAVNIHILGDHQSDNSVFTGLMKLETLIGQIVIELRNLDQIRSRKLIQGITLINKQQANPQKKADALMIYLKNNMPFFVKEAQNGQIKRRLEGRGFYLR